MSDWVGGLRLMPSHDIESQFAVEDGMAHLDFSIDEFVDAESEERLDQIRDIMSRLPHREADFVELYYFMQKKQTDIAAIFGVSQPTVCYRLQRAAERIRFLMALPVVDMGDARPRIEGVLTDPIDVEVLYRMHETTCQSEVAKALGVSQGFVRHRFLRSISRLRAAGHTDIAYMFDVIAANLNLLREIQRATPDIGVACVIR